MPKKAEPVAEESNHKQPLLSNRLMENLSIGDGNIKIEKRKKKKAMQVDEAEASYDPFLTLGYGMIAYRNLQQIFIFFFLFSSLLLIPVMNSNYSAQDSSQMLGWAQYSLGNQGYSSSYC